MSTSTSNLEVFPAQIIAVISSLELEGVRGQLGVEVGSGRATLPAGPGKPLAFDTSADYSRVSSHTSAVGGTEWLSHLPGSHSKMTGAE